MVRFSGLFVLTAMWAAPSLAQSPFANPTVWVSASVGALPWAQDAGPNDRDNQMTSFGLTAASPRWMAQGGMQISGEFLSWGWNVGERSTYRTLYAAAGPWAQSEWFMVGAALGPALTWGTRIETGVLPCSPGVETCVWTGPLQLESEAYLNPGLAGSVQGFVQIGGRVWIGGEYMIVANRSSTHLATRVALRVDLLRPAQ